MVFRCVSARSPIYQLRDEMDRLVSGMFHSSPFGALARREGPAVNVWEENDALRVEMELPGVKPHEIDVAVVENELTIRVDVPETKEEGVTYHRRERPVGSASRRIRLPYEVDGERVSAELARGILQITLPKSASATPRKIDVKVTE